MTTQTEALNLALEALELNNTEWKSLADSDESSYWLAEEQDHYQQTEQAITAIKEALAQPEQIMQDSTCSTTLRLQGKPYPRTCKKCGLGPCIAQPTAQPEQEPVAWEQFYPDIGKPQIAINPEIVGYVAPQRTWVGLTDEEMQSIAFESADALSAVFVAEAKLKEKNNG